MMSTRTTLVLVALTLLMALGIRLFDGGEAKENTRRRAEEGIFRIDPATVGGFSISTARGSISARRDAAGRWFLASPVAARADADAVERFLDAMAQLPKGEAVTPPRGSAEEMYASYGLDLPRARLAIDTGGKTNLFLIGRRSPLGDGVYVRKEGAQTIMRTDGKILAALPANAEELRSRTLLSGEADAIRRMDLRCRGGFFQLARGSDGGWRMRQPFEGRANALKVAELLDVLFSCKVERFAQDRVSDFTPFGLGDESTQTVVLGTDAADGSEILIFGSPVPGAGDLAYARFKAEPSVYAVKAAAPLALASLTAEGLLEPELPKVSEADAAAIDLDGIRLIRTPEGTWKTPEAPADGETVQAVLAAWNALRADRFRPAREDEALDSLRRIRIRRSPTKGGGELVAEVAKRENGEAAFRLAGESNWGIGKDPGVWELPETEAACRAKEIFSLDLDDVARIERKGAGGAWQPEKETGALTAFLTPLRAEEILATDFEAPVEPGEDDEAIRIHHKGKGALRTTLVRRPDGTAYVQGMPLLFTIPPLP